MEACPSRLSATSISSSRKIDGWMTGMETEKYCLRGKCGKGGCEFYDGGRCLGVVYPTYPPKYGKCIFDGRTADNLSSFDLSSFNADTTCENSDSYVRDVLATLLSDFEESDSSGSRTFYEKERLIRVSMIKSALDKMK